MNGYSRYDQNLRIKEMRELGVPNLETYPDRDMYLTHMQQKYIYMYIV